jgi:hypothetical protein
MENEEERHKFEAKRTSDEKVTSKTVKPGSRVGICADGQFRTADHATQNQSAKDHFLRTAGVHLRTEGKQADGRFQPDLLTFIFSF